MSLHLEFEPHSYYKGFAIKHNDFVDVSETVTLGVAWGAYTENGNTYRVDKLTANTLKELKQLIKEYRSNMNPFFNTYTIEPIKIAEAN